MVHCVQCLFHFNLRCVHGRRVASIYPRGAKKLHQIIFLISLSNLA